MAAANASFASPSADAHVIPALTSASAVTNIVGRMLQGMSVWSVLVTLLAIAVVYDQG